MSKPPARTTYIGKRKHRALQSRNSAIDTFESSGAMRWFKALEPIGIVVGVVALFAAFFYGEITRNVEQQMLIAERGPTYQAHWDILQRPDDASRAAITNAFRFLYANGGDFPRIELRCRDMDEGSMLCNRPLWLTDLILPSRNGVGLNLRDAVMSSVSIRWSELPDVDLSNAEFDMSGISDTDISGAKATGMQMHTGILTDTDASRVRFKESSFTNVQLDGSSFVDSDFEGALLTGIHWSSEEPDFTGANISNASITLRRSFYDGITPGYHVFDAAWAWEDRLPSISGTGDPPKFLVCDPSLREDGFMYEAISLVGPPDECVALGNRYDPTSISIQVRRTPINRPDREDRGR